MPKKTKSQKEGGFTTSSFDGEKQLVADVTVKLSEVRGSWLDADIDLVYQEFNFNQFGKIVVQETTLDTRKVPDRGTWSVAKRKTLLH